MARSLSLAVAPRVVGVPFSRAVVRGNVELQLSELPIPRAFVVCVFRRNARQQVWIILVALP